MPSYIVVDLTPINKEKLAEYSALAAETLAPFNGHFIAKGESQALHGDKPHPLKAILEFPDKESAINWYHSDAYQAIIPIREQAIQCQFHLL
ncbi:DUF1330 domain-containing protein [Marinomonas mediterranea]|jgi:Uncharacterized conserved protein|uniref:DUF1330 domain-containing protein n=1 Tax=Marinomonas mediterranea (strain ATCC 700492 / JCM 21426 / NBRC 103028 / MMB-1) TaxID=717774 RepID=F2JU86_MARM1|nr:DUF1330 domain-containing protein [Marinomonas mediterranea]ADZ91598.1 protein of unknown function DUF1330 [Marinomonas mediterranea MMB-1]WCN09558.1 DUF1330 domain-containing protein [Marinomonas mediterranea]WCN13636.1 DUF1330 domain-containing protein [Marinomonas mediterranea]WCN17699.1 DUF1330 domain-containing protein [Marinomonas mediterranea MMB-1]